MLEYNPIFDSNHMVARKCWDNISRYWHAQQRPLLCLVSQHYCGHLNTLMSLK